MSRNCTYTAGQCTDYVSQVFAWVGCWGDAWQWLDRAKAAGFATSSRPVIGSIAVWGQGAGAASNGHVAIVTGIQGDGLPIVSEMNATAGPFAVDQRSVDAAGARGIEGYILPQQGASLADVTIPNPLPVGPHGFTIPAPGPNVTAPIAGQGFPSLGGITDVAGGFLKALQTLTSQSFWWRVGFVALGLGLIGAGVFMVAQESPSVQNAERMMVMA